MFKSRELASGASVLAIGLFLSAPARAHFVLKAPAASLVQESNGDPQKVAPCGGAGTPTGVVTAYQPGQTIEITIDETIPHPGHYRIALAVNDPKELPAEPEVLPLGGTSCESAAIMSPPVFPVLADGVFTHTAPFTGPQTVKVQLPLDVTCANCTLQIIEFMSSHGTPCFYHHCANISIGGPAVDGGTGAPVGNGDASTEGDSSDGGTASDSGTSSPRATGSRDTSDSGCSTSGSAKSGLAGVLMLAAISAFSMRRRRTR